MFNKERWFKLATQAPFKISHYCCTIMKKSPLGIFERQNKLYPILGTMADESLMRRQAWLRHGCNAFDSKHPTSQPLSFWTEQDVLQYIKENNLEIASVYGDILQVDKNDNPVDVCENIGYFDSESEWHDGTDDLKLKCSGCQRTGCIFCAFGAHLEKGETRFQRLAKTHPKQYDYCINGGQWIDNPDYDPSYNNEPDEIGWVKWNPKQLWVPSKEGLGMGKVFDIVNEIYEKDLIRYK